MTEVDFLILVENVKRGELENACLLACELEKRGFKTKIRYYRNIGRYHLKPHVVITPNCYSLNEIINYGCFFRCDSIKIVNLQYEQVIFKNAEDTKLYGMSGFAEHAAHITWGEGTKKRLTSKGISEEKIFVTGHISMDFYDSKYDKLFLRKDQLEQRYKIPPNRRWNLFASNFVYINENVFQAVKENLPDIDLDCQRNKMIESQKIILKWLEKALLRYPNQIFIYRPHPSEEKVEEIKKMDKMYSNFYYISEFSIKQWIRYADELMIYSSTSIVDAYFSKVRSHIIRPVKIEPRNDSMIMVSSKKVVTEEEFLDIFSLSEGSYYPIDEKNIEDYYGLQNDFKSYKNVADVCEMVFMEDKYRISYDDLKLFHYWSLKHFIVEVIENVICSLPIYHFVKKNKKAYLTCKTDFYQSKHIKRDGKRIKNTISKII